MSNTITIKDLTDFKDAIVSELRGDITDLRKEFQSDITDLRTELKTDIASLRVEFKADLADLRAELRGDMADLRSELESCIAGLREEMLAGFAGVAEAIDSVLRQLDDYHQYQKHQSKQLTKLDYRVVMVETRLSRRQQAGGFGPA